MLTPSRRAPVASCILAVALLAPGMPWRGATPSAPLYGSTQLAKDTHASKMLDTDDRGAGEDTWHSSAVRVRGRVKFQASGYDAGRVRRFWRHYHGVRTEEKTKRAQVAR